MNTRLSAIIIDDEPEAIISLEIMLNNLAEIIVTGSTIFPGKALSLYKETMPDLVFLDINMPGIDGFAVLDEILSHNYHPYVIFTTGHNEYALKALKAGVFDYLLKPFNSNELECAVQRVLKHKDSHNLEKRIEELEKAVQHRCKLRFNTRSGLILIHPDDILYIEADANYSEIHFSKEKWEVVSMNLGTVEAMLPRQFIRISRSLIVNSYYLSKISGVNKTCYIKKDKEELAFSIPEKQMPEIKRWIDTD